MLGTNSKDGWLHIHTCIYTHMLAFLGEQLATFSQIEIKRTFAYFTSEKFENIFFSLNEPIQWNSRAALRLLEASNHMTCHICSHTSEWSLASVSELRSRTLSAHSHSRSAAKCLDTLSACLFATSAYNNDNKDGILSTVTLFHCRHF